MRLRQKDRQSLLGYVLILPTFIFLGIFMLRPLIETVLYSFQKRSLLNPDAPTQYVGLSNWRKLFGNSSFFPDLRNTIVLSVASTVTQILLGLAIALMLNRRFPLRSWVRAIAILPWAMPTIAAAFVFRWIFDASFGTANTILNQMGIEPIAWLGTPTLAMFSLILVHVWKGLPFVILVFLAALQSVPIEQYEAARVDGASKWIEFRFITLPSIRFVVTIIFVLRIIWTFNWFDLTFMLTGGGPGTSTMTLPLDVYTQAFRNYDVGMASTFAAFMSLVLLIFAIWFLRLNRKAQGE
jgi:ABC-type sugar transport system permease subunit